MCENNGLLLYARKEDKEIIPKPTPAPNPLPKPKPKKKEILLD